MGYIDLESMNDLKGKICRHCGEKFNRVLDPAIGSIVNLGKQSAFLGNLHHNYSLGVIEDDNQMFRFEALGYKCTKCGRVSLHIIKYSVLETGASGEIVDEFTINPFGKERPVPEEIPLDIAEDYREASKIANISLKGSATILRRCLQATLRRVYPEMPNSELYDEIKWIEGNIEFGEEEEIIKDTLHLLRKAGNFGAHPPKNGLTPIFELNGEDLESCFDLLDILFKKFFIEPERTRLQLKKLKDKISPPREDSR